MKCFDSISSNCMWFLNILLRKLITCLVNCGDNQLRKIHKTQWIYVHGYLFLSTTILVFSLSTCQPSKSLLSFFPLSILPSLPPWQKSSATLEFTITFSRHNDVYQGLRLNLTFSLCVEIRRARPHKRALNLPECKNHLHYFLKVRFHGEGAVSWIISPPKDMFHS